MILVKKEIKPFSPNITKVGFGKYKELVWNDVPRDYAEWLLTRPDSPQFTLYPEIEQFLLNKFNWILERKP